MNFITASIAFFWADLSGLHSWKAGRFAENSCSLQSLMRSLDTTMTHSENPMQFPRLLTSRNVVGSTASRNAANALSGFTLDTVIRPFVAKAVSRATTVPLQNGRLIVAHGCESIEL